jgi:hypothetical protein
MPNLGSSLRKWGLVGAGGVGVSFGVLGAGAMLPPPENVNPDRILSYYYGASRFGMPGGLVGGAAGAYLGVRFGGLGVKGSILTGLLGAGVGSIVGTAAGVSQFSGGAMTSGARGMMEQSVSAGTYATLSQMDALRANIARLHRPIRGMGY